MTTTAKDFKVKHGLQVGQGGSFGGAVVVGTPSSSNHATTKSYVDSLVSSSVGGMVVGSNPPESPENGDLWFDTNEERVKVYYGSIWITIATIDDTLTLPDHTHDTSIGGNGLVTAIFIDGGTPSSNEPEGTTATAGFYNTTDWNQTWNGGLVSNEV